MASLGFKCTKCPDRERRVVIAVVLAAVGVGAVVVIANYLVSGEMGGTGVLDRVMRRMPLSSLKILIVAWQILTQVRVLLRYMLLVIISPVDTCQRSCQNNCIRGPFPKPGTYLRNC